MKILTKPWTLLMAFACLSIDTIAQSEERSTTSDSLIVIYSARDLYSLRPTYEMKLDHFFTHNTKLAECNDQLVKQVKKLKALKEFKYFETIGGFGLISEIKEIKNMETENVVKKKNFFQRLFGLGSSASISKRVYIFLVIKNDLNEELTPNFKSLSKTYKNRQLERKWANIKTLEALLNNPDSKYNAQQHSFVMRVYEFKKEQLAKAFNFIIGDNTYALDPKVLELFKK